MANTQDPTHGCTGTKRPPQKKVKSSTKPKKRKRSSQNVANRERVRVNIGSAFERWRALKATKGLKSDAEVAQCLLNAMKRPSKSPSPGPSDKKIKFSQSEVLTLIEQEVHNAAKKHETKLQSLIETVQQLDHGVDFESTIQKLEAQINRVTQKAEAAFAHMTNKEKKSPLPSLVNVYTIRPDSKNETMETMSQIKQSLECTDQSRELFQMMGTTKKAVEKLRADNEALTAAIADLKEELPPPILSPHGSPVKGLLRVIKKDPDDQQENEKHVEEPKPVEEPKAERVKEECLSPDDSDRLNHTNSKQKNKLVYPPLPSNPFPSVLNMEAASYNIPQRPEVNLALIRSPPTLSILWDVKEEDPSAPPMDCYSVYMTMEKVKGSGVFPKWTLRVVEAKTLPICLMMTKYKPGHQVCAAVVGKDKFGRYGPYSKVVTAAIPE